MTRRKVAVLFIIPVLLFILLCLFLRDASYFYMSWSDPVYCYLFNGLNLATGKMIIGHTDHPGTTVQLLSAIIIRVVHLFRSNPLPEDVLKNPELYLKAATIFLMFINCSVIFQIGYLVSKLSGHIALGLLFQLTPLIVAKSFYFIPHLMTEPVIVFSGLILVLVYFYYNHQNNSANLNQNRNIIIFALLAGFSIATKFSAFPILCIPVFILPKISNKIKFLVLSVIFFFIFIFPIWKQLNNFFSFIYQIIVHTGMYGGGTSGVINPSLYFSNIKSLLTTEYVYTFIYFIFWVVLIFSILKKTHRNNFQFKMLAGIVCATTLQILIVAKHTSFHYLIPVQVYSILGLYISYLIIKPIIFSGSKFFTMRVSVFPVSILAVFLFVRVIIEYHFFKNISNPILYTKEIIEKNKLPRIIVAGSTGVYPESALYFGKIYSGLRPYYDKLLKIEYPDSYFYSSSDNIFSDWSLKFTAQEIAARYPEFLIYFNYEDTAIRRKIFHQFDLLNKKNKIIRYTRIFQNNLSGEILYKFISDTFQAAALYKVVNEYYCNADSISPDKFFVGKNIKIKYQNDDELSTLETHSGKYSLKLSSGSPYGMGIDLQANKNYFYDLSVWRKSNAENGLIVATVTNPSDFYTAGASVIETGSKGWELVCLKFKLPSELRDSIIKVYLWNEGKQDVYFDDFRIREIENLTNP